jgi:hypothetical protein
MPQIPYMIALFGDTPIWISEGIIFVAMAYTICVFGVAFGKMGRSPFWGLIFLLPFLGTIMLWVFGLGRWPQASRNVEMESGL